MAFMMCSRASSCNQQLEGEPRPHSGTQDLSIVLGSLFGSAFVRQGEGTAIPGGWPLRRPLSFWAAFVAVSKGITLSLPKSLRDDCSLEESRAEEAKQKMNTNLAGAKYSLCVIPFKGLKFST